MAEVPGAPANCEFDGDEAKTIWDTTEHGSHYEPAAWHSSPSELQAQAKASNEVGYSGAFAAAGKHSQPPAWKPEHFLS